MFKMICTNTKDGKIYFTQEYGSEAAMLEELAINIDNDNRYDNRHFGYECFESAGWVKREYVQKFVLV